MPDESVEATTQDGKVILCWHHPCGHCGEDLVKMFPEQIVTCYRCGEKWA